MNIIAKDLAAITEEDDLANYNTELAEQGEAAQKKKKNDKK